MTDFLSILESKLDFSHAEAGVIEKWFSRVERDARFSNAISSGGGGDFVTAVQAGNVVIDLAEGITLFNPTTGEKTIYLDPDGDASFGSDIDDPGTTALKILSNAQTYNTEDFGAGDLLLGDNSDGKANLLWDQSAGQLVFRSGTTAGIVLDVDGTLQSGNFSTGASGWKIDPDGDAEFNNITARGTFRTSVFAYENIMAMGGSSLWSKAASEVNTTVVSASSFTLEVKTAEDGTTALFEVDDYGRCKGWSGSVFIDIWVKVTAVSTSGGVSTLTVDLKDGGTGRALRKSMALVNYGPTGSGVLELQAGEQSTRLRIATHAGSPWITMTNKVVLGNMRDTFGTGANDRYGFGVGDYSGGNYMTYNADISDSWRIVTGNGAITIGSSGIRLRQSAGGNISIQLENDGDAFFGSAIATPATTSLAIFSNAQTYNTESMGAGDVLFGDNSSNKANMLWDKSAGELLFRSGKTAATVKINTAGNLVIDNDIFLGEGTYGIWFKGTGGDSRRVAWSYFDDPDFRIAGDVFSDYIGGDITVTYLRAIRQAGDPWDYAALSLTAFDTESGIGPQIYIHSGDGGSISLLGGDAIQLLDADVLIPDGDLYTDLWQDYSGDSTVIGWGSFTTKQIYYKRVGNLVTVTYLIAGTSNVTGVTFTLPYSAVAGVNVNGATPVRDNGTWAGGNYTLNSGTDIVTCRVGWGTGGTTWTASGTKIVKGNFTYEAV